MFLNDLSCKIMFLLAKKNFEQRKTEFFKRDFFFFTQIFFHKFLILYHFQWTFCRKIMDFAKSWSFILMVKLKNIDFNKI